MNTSIRALIDARSQIQKARIAFEGRARAIDQGADEVPQDDNGRLMFAEKYRDRFDEFERLLTADLVAEGKKEAIVRHITELKGISFVTATQLVAMIDIERADTISALWRYAGYGVADDGTIDRRRKGEKDCYNSRLKCLMHVVVTNIIKCSGRGEPSPYVKVYNDSKLFYLENKDWTKGHIHMAALRRMKKLLLAHLWKHWRELDGLPTREPYVHEKMGHTHMIEPRQFGWPDVKSYDLNPDGATEEDITAPLEKVAEVTST